MKNQTKLVQFMGDKEPTFGVINDDEITEISGSPYGEFTLTDISFELSSARLLPPSNPTKILAAAVNYRDHSSKEHELPKKPELFIKLPSSVVGQSNPIILPEDAGRVDAEGELVAVIGKKCSKVSPEEALSFVLGYTCGNDVSARDWQRDDTQWWRAKSTDTFTSVGPYITTNLDPDNLELEVTINGKRIQAANTSQLVFDVASLISFASQSITLEEGDLIFTGTPGTTSAMEPGDVVDVTIEGIGKLSNPIRSS